MRIFWDWDRTLGTKPFWHKLTDEDSDFAVRLTDLFASDDVRPWMRGAIRFEDIHSKFLKGYDLVYLRERLAKDWQVADVFNDKLWSYYVELYPDAKHYVVTDNMDVFNDFVAANPAFFERFEKVYNSSDYGVLKSDHESLFGLIRKDLGDISFVGDLLLDDSAENCETFKSLGGNAIVVDKAR